MSVINEEGRPYNEEERESRRLITPTQINGVRQFESAVIDPSEQEVEILDTGKLFDYLNSVYDKLEDAEESIFEKDYTRHVALIEAIGPDDYLIDASIGFDEAEQKLEDEDLTLYNSFNLQTNLKGGRKGGGRREVECKLVYGLTTDPEADKNQLIRADLNYDSPIPPSGSYESWNYYDILEEEGFDPHLLNFEVALSALHDEGELNAAEPWGEKPEEIVEKIKEL